MKLFCGQCRTDQEMTKKFYGKKENEFSWWCPNCKDRISQSAVSISKASGEKK